MVKKKAIDVLIETLEKFVEQHPEMLCLWALTQAAKEDIEAIRVKCKKLLAVTNELNEVVRV